MMVMVRVRDEEDVKVVGESFVYQGCSVGAITRKY